MAGHDMSTMGDMKMDGMAPADAKPGAAMAMPAGHDMSAMSGGQGGMDVPEGGSARSVVADHLREALSEAYGWLSDLVKAEPNATGLNNEDLFIPQSDCRLYAPVRGSKIVAVGRNYPGYSKASGKHGGQLPAGFVKVPSCIVGPGRDILKPVIT